MNWQYFLLLLIIKNVFSYKSKYQFNKPSKSIFSNNKHSIPVTPARYNGNNKAKYSPTMDKLPEYFPTVEYPSSILDSGNPFYFHSSENNAMLSAFPNDVKRSFKSYTQSKPNIKSIYANDFISPLRIRESIDPELPKKGQRIQREDKKNEITATDDILNSSKETTNEESVEELPVVEENGKMSKNTLNIEIKNTRTSVEDSIEIDEYDANVTEPPDIECIIDNMNYNDSSICSDVLEDFLEPDLIPEGNIDIELDNDLMNDTGENFEEENYDLPTDICEIIVDEGPKVSKKITIEECPYKINAVLMNKAKKRQKLLQNLRN